MNVFKLLGLIEWNVKYKLAYKYFDNQMTNNKLTIRLAFTKRRVNQILQQLDKKDKTCLEYKLKNKSYK